jgi:hypothetical protein
VTTTTRVVVSVVMSLVMVSVVSVVSILSNVMQQAAPLVSQRVEVVEVADDLRALVDSPGGGIHVALH